VQLYGALPQGGRAAQLYALQGGAQQSQRRMMTRAAAWQVSHILASITPPNGAASRAGQIAYKTGTSYGHRDAWAIGFDGAHVIGVWLGRPDGTPVPGVFGGDLAAPILFEAFGRLKAAPDPLPGPPPETLIVSTASLPAPLQRFRPRDAVFAVAANYPVVAFPPDGAVLQRGLDGVSLKLRAGVLPLTILVDGAPIVTGLHRRDVVLPLTSPGFSRISVIDAMGQAVQVQIRLD
jgi:penicillin-binding protein 1C